jgi:competence protein ComEC
MRLDTGERVVAPFLWNRGVLTLAAVVATHDDADHVGGMAAVRRLFSVGESLDRRTIGIAPRWFGGAMLSPLAGGRGDTLELPSFEAPGPVVPRTARERNDDALVLRIDFGLASFLLVSDIGAAAERGLLAARAPLLATVLKVAHHGSRTSSTPEFLRAVRPAIAVVSVGARNPYGHPDAATLERLTSAGARTFRTDRDGAVLFETDGRELTVTRWAERRRERYCLDPDTPC